MAQATAISPVSIQRQLPSKLNETSGKKHYSLKKGQSLQMMIKLMILKRIKQLKESGSAISLNDIYKKYWFDRFKGDADKLTLHTVKVLLESEIPLYFFTLLDLLKLKSLFKYRLHYKTDLVEHLGIRNYPPRSLTLKAMRVGMKNFYLAYVIPTYVLISLGNALGIHAYDTEADEKKVTWRRLFKEVFMISVIADVLFYWAHRYMHQPSMYLKYHKMHHEFKYTIAFAHHWATFGEAAIFFFPQVIPPLLLWAIRGKPHVLSLWFGMLFTQLNAIIGHSGYRIPFIPEWLPFLQASYHDYHHVHYKVNFGAIFPFTDMMFGTYSKPGLELDLKKILANVKNKTRFFFG